MRSYVCHYSAVYMSPYYVYKNRMRFSEFISLYYLKISCCLHKEMEANVWDEQGFHQTHFPKD